MRRRQKTSKTRIALFPFVLLWPTKWWETFLARASETPMWKKCLIFVAGYIFTVLITPIYVPLVTCYFILYMVFRPPVRQIRQRIRTAKEIRRPYFREGPMYPAWRNPDYEVKELPQTRARNLTLVLGSDLIKPMEGKSAIDMGPVDPMDPEKGLGQRSEADQQADRDSRHAPVQQKTIDQLNTCQFWRLPPEVRELIWLYAVGNGYVHILRRKNRLRSVYCPAKNPIDPIRRDLCLSNRDGQGYHVPTAWPPHNHSLSLLSSCRQIYSEAIDFLYSSNTFAFDNPDACTLFFQNLLPHRRRLVSSIQFDYTEKHSDMGWGCCMQKLAGLHLIKLSRITITPMLENAHTGVFPPEMADRFARLMVGMTAWGERRGASVTCAWCSDGVSDSGHALHTPRDQYLPSPQHLATCRFENSPQPRLMTFFIPFHVRCLHCDAPTIIRRATKGFAQVSVIEREEEYRPPSSPHAEQSDASETNAVASSGWVPVRKRYCTFHTFCGGWIEFQCDVRTSEWSVAFGAREISEEEAAAHLEEHGEKYAPMKTREEMVEGLEIQVNDEDWESPDRSERAVNSETWDRLWDDGTDGAQ